MLKIRYRIALLIGGTVLLMLLIIMAVFNYCITHRIAEQADASLNSAVTFQDYSEALQENNTADWTIYAPEQIIVTDTQDQFFSPKEQEMIRWCANQPKDQTMKTAINGNTYYIRKSEPDYGFLYYNSLSVSVESDEADASDTVPSWISIITNSDRDALRAELPGDAEMIQVQQIIAYVDITGELETIRQINLIFLLSALGVGLFGSAAGFVLGKKLEQNQLVQKQFFENTSHELKTPLTAIRGYAEGISQGIITDYAKTGRVIAEQTEKMSSLVEEILCMAKIESGALKPEKETVDVPDFLQDCLMPFEGTVLAKKLNVQLDLQPMKVSADPGQLEHALTNLLINALKYARTEIRISCGDGLICIENDCNSLTDDLVQHLFERFYTGPDGNTGIGLSLAKDYLTLHGWTITAVRTENGIRFEIKCN